MSSIGRRNTYYKLSMWSEDYEEKIALGTRLKNVILRYNLGTINRVTIGENMRRSFLFLVLIFPLSACHTWYGVHYVTAVPAMPEQNCVANTLSTVTGVSDVVASVQRTENRTQIAPRYKKMKYRAEIVRFSFENQPFIVQTSGNDDELLARVSVSKMGSCPIPERMKSFFKIQQDVTQALSNTCFKNAKFDKSKISKKECPVE